MKMCKKWIAALLAVAMVVTGLWIVKPEAEEVKAAETVEANTVDPDMLTIKMQAREATYTNEEGQEVTDLRIVSSVNGLGYKEVGFQVWFNQDVVDQDGNLTKPVATFTTQTVLKRIQAGVEYEFSPKVIDTSSEYFVTATLKGILKDNWGKDFYIRAFVTPYEGSEADRVYGVGRYFNLNDATAKSTINIPVEMAEPTTTTVVVDQDNNITKEQIVGTVTLGTTSTTATETIAYLEYYDNESGYANINVVVPEGDKELLTSATTISVSGTAASDGESAVSGTAIYRNLKSSYNGTDGDTTWYTEYQADGETEFVIATDADFYGLRTAYKSDRDTSTNTCFDEMKVYLVADITANEVAIDETKTGAEKYAWNTEYKWASEGTAESNKYKFNGTFDGQGHTIRGIYGTGSIYVGLFGATGAGAIVQNFSLVDSYFNTTGTYVGSVAGRGLGTFNNIYSNAMVDSAGSYCGGIVAQSNDATTYTNCNFAGELLMAAGAQYGGGIVGNIFNAVTNSITDCVFSGSISSATATDGKAPTIGGICGYVRIYNTLGQTQTTTISNSWSTGTITTNFSSSDGQIGSLVGYKYEQAGTINLTIESTNYVTDTSLQQVGSDDTVSSATTYSENAIDLRWYNDVTKDCVIYDAEDLYGVYFVCNVGGNTFDEYTIRLGADIIVNEGTPLGADGEADEADEENQDDWQYVAPAKTWTPIGTYKEGSRFNGTFNGLDAETGEIHSISGLYRSSNAQYQGLFATLGADAKVENLKLINSYFEYTGKTHAMLGSIAGRTHGGGLEKVYSNAIVRSSTTTSGGYVGGLIGQIANGDFTCNLVDCWFDGSVTLQAEADSFAGGIVGEVRANLNIEHCLNTGEITAYKYVGGLVGLVKQVSGTVYRELTIEDSLNTGTVSANSAGGLLVGGAGRYSGITMDSAYAAIQDTMSAVGDASADGAVIRSAAEDLVDADNLKGNVAPSYASKLSFTDKGDGIHWVVGDAYPVLAWF